LFKSKKPGTVFHQWGGGTAAFFGYTHLSHDLCTGLLIALLPLIKAGLGLTYFQSGLLLSAFTITAGLSQFPGGWLGDRLSKRIVIAIGLGGVSLTALAVGLSPAYYPMLVILVIMGIFAGAYHPSAVSVLSNYFEEARRGKVIALHMVGGSIGFALGPVLGGLIAGALGWRFAFIILCFPALAAIPLVLRKLRQQRYLGVNSGRLVSQEPASDGITAEPGRGDIRISQVWRPIVIITAMVILSQFVSGCATAFLPLFLVDKHGIAPAYAAMLMGVVRGGGIAGSLFGGWLSDKWSRKNTIFLALVAIGPILYLLTKLPFHGGLILVFILVGTLMYMRMAAVQPFLMDNVPPRFRATVFGIYFGLGMEGGSLLQPVAGHYMDVFGIAAVFNIIALIGIALSVISLISALKTKLH